MSARERELRRVVVKGSRCPGVRTMTVGAKMIEAVRDVIRIRHGDKVSGVTTVASLARSGVGLRMTGDTLERSVRADQ